jgi:hypothetical protein
MRGRKPLPIETKKLKGTLETHRLKKPTVAPAPLDPIGPAPECLTPGRAGLLG